MRKILSEHALSLRQQRFSLRLIAIPLVVLTALAANFAPWLFAAAAGLAVFYYFWHHRANLILFLIVYTPLEELVLKIVPDSVYAPLRFMWEGMLFVMMGLMLVERLLLTRSWKHSLIDRALVIFVIAWFTSGLFNHVPLGSSLVHIKNLVRYIPLFYIIYNLKLDTGLLRKVVTAVIVIGIIEAVICIGQAIEGDVLVRLFQPREVVVGGQLIRGLDVQLGSYHTKFTGTFDRANTLGNYLAFAICFAVAGYFMLGRKRAYLLATLPMVVALIICSSRISWISAFVAVGVILFAIRNRRRYLYLVAPVAIGALLYSGAAVVGADAVHGDFDILSRLFILFSPEFIDIMATTGRLYAVLYVAPAVILASPLLGLGPGAFMQISKQMSADVVFAKADALGLYPAAVKYVHDVGYVALFVQVGLLGLAAMLWIFIKMYRQAKATLAHATDPMVRTFLLASVGFFVALAIQNLAGFNLTYRNQSLLIWIVAGLVALLGSVNKATEGKGQ